MVTTDLDRVKLEVQRVVARREVALNAYSQQLSVLLTLIEWRAHYNIAPFMGALVKSHEWFVTAQEDLEALGDELRQRTKELGAETEGGSC